MVARSKRLVEYLVSLSPADLPPSVTQSAISALLDNVGCGLFGAQQQWGRIVTDYVISERSQGAATLFGSSHPIAPARAALANGTATHGFEFDDTLYAQTHPGAVIVPAALAAAEQAGASGERLILAVIAGYEMMGRLVKALGIDHSNRGYHTTGVAGPVAATIAAGIVMKLTAAQLLAAIGNACSSSSGIKAFTQGTGGMTKRMHAGRPAESGIVACELALRGFTGPLEAIDGSFGLLQVIGGSAANAEHLDQALGQSFAISDTSVKVYPCCAVNHSTVHALEKLKQDYGFTAADVATMRIGTSQRGVAQNGGREPIDSMAAQYSLPFCAAAAVIKSARDPNTFVDDRLDDPAVRDLAAQTTLFVADEVERIYPTKLGARVEVYLRNGQELRASVFDPPGSVGNPCSRADIEAKFRILAASVKPPAGVERILQAINNLPTANTLTELSSALRD